MAVPKHKTSKSKRDKRRTHHKIGAPDISVCKDCGQPSLPHHACSKCGKYRGRQVMNIKED